MGINRNSVVRASPDPDMRTNIHLTATIFQIDRNVNVISCSGVSGIVSTEDFKSLETLHELSRTTRMANVVVAYGNFSFSLDGVNFVDVAAEPATPNTSKSYKFTAQDVRLESISLA